MNDLRPLMPVLRRGPVVLREFADSDAALVRTVGSDPHIPLITSVPTSGSDEDIRAFLLRQRDRLPSGVGYSFAIAEATSNKAVGQIGLWLRDLDLGRATIGFWLAPDARGRGYLRAALGELSDWALSFAEVERLQLFVEPWNSASWRAAEACGFRQEGLLRSWERVGEERRDMYVYSRLS